MVKSIQISFNYFIISVLDTFTDKLIKHPSYFHGSWYVYWWNWFKSPFIFSFLLILMINLFQPHSIFIVLCTLTHQIDSNTHFIVSAVVAFSCQTDSNLISLSLFLILSLVKPIQILFHFHCFWYFYRSNRLKSPFIFRVLSTFTDKSNWNSISLSLFSLILQIKSIKIHFNFHGSWHFYL